MLQNEEETQVLTFAKLEPVNDKKPPPTLSGYLNKCLIIVQNGLRAVSSSTQW